MGEQRVHRWPQSSSKTNEKLRCLGLYVAPKENHNTALWEKTDAMLQPVGEADLVWRGFRYDTYTFEKLLDWKPELAPPEDDEFYTASPS